MITAVVAAVPSLAPTVSLEVALMPIEQEQKVYWDEFYQGRSEQGSDLDWRGR